MIYFFAICFTQAATDYRQDHDGTVEELDDPYLIIEHFGDLAKSFYSMYMSMSGGQNWGEVVQPLYHCTPGWMFVGLFDSHIGIGSKMF